MGRWEAHRKRARVTLSLGAHLDRRRRGMVSIGHSVGIELLGEVLQPSRVLIGIGADDVAHGLAIVLSGPLGVAACLVHVSESLEPVYETTTTPADDADALADNLRTYIDHGVLSVARAPCGLSGLGMA